MSHLLKNLYSLIWCIPFNKQYLLKKLHFLSSRSNSTYKFATLAPNLVTSDEIKNTFIKYFEEKGYHKVTSASLIADKDPELLFTSAGMVPFKSQFLGQQPAIHQKIFSIQKCLRVKGKHNDLNTVGHSPCHNTYFEMLGSFSFGELSRAEAIQHCWEFLIERFCLPQENFIVTVYKDDFLTYDIWMNIIGLPERQISRKGENDNWWSMGSTGPCGPCTEIYWDFGAPLDCKTRYLELWNIVFIEKEMSSDGKITDLPRKCIDTGMGLERLAVVLQQKKSIFETDLFSPIMEFVQSRADNSISLKKKKENTRLLADHIRACVFLIAEGVQPRQRPLPFIHHLGKSYIKVKKYNKLHVESVKGGCTLFFKSINVDHQNANAQGHVLRKLIRSAAFAAYELDIKDNFLSSLAEVVVKYTPSATCSQVVSRVPLITEVLQKEETAFHKTLEKGLVHLKKIIKETLEKSIESHVLSSDAVFLLLDTHGLPEEVVAAVANKHNLFINFADVRQLLSKQQLRSRLHQSKKRSLPLDAIEHGEKINVRSRFIGYDFLQCETKVVWLRSTNKADYVVLENNIFYAESGGQVSDTGSLILSSGKSVEVLGCRFLLNDIPVVVLPPNSQILCNDTVKAFVNKERRARVCKYHTATHLLSHVLKVLYGDGVAQAGSFVGEKKLRFDFTKNGNKSFDKSVIEKEVNTIILLDLPIFIETNVSDQEALKNGAVATFSNKYGPSVRTVQIKGKSTELCCGTHVTSTGTIFPFKITSLSSISSDIMRIEAHVSEDAFNIFNDYEMLYKSLLDMLKANTKDRLVSVIKGLINKNKEMTNFITELARKPLYCAARSQIPFGGNLIYFHRETSNAPKDYIKKRIEHLCSLAPDGLHIIVSGSRIYCRSPNKEEIPANQILQKLLRELKGKGGGTEVYAQGTFNNELEDFEFIRAINNLK